MSRRLTYKEVRNYIALKGDTLLSEEHDLDHHKLKIRCGICEEEYHSNFKFVQPLEQING